jgi:hypothetical protein
VEIFGLKTRAKVDCCINEALRRKTPLDPNTKLPVDPGFDFGHAVEQLFDERYKPVYLLFDQFEELLISGAEDEKRDFFAHPYHSWERGLNENTNGLIRQYIPKAQNIKELSEHDCKNVQDKLNNRPRKALGFLSPIEFFHKTCASPPAVAFEP